MESITVTIKFAMFYGFEIFVAAVVVGTVIAGLYQAIRSQVGSLQGQVHESHVAWMMKRQFGRCNDGEHISDGQVRVVSRDDTFRGWRNGSSSDRWTVPDRAGQDPARNRDSYGPVTSTNQSKVKLPRSSQEQTSQVCS